MILKIRYYIGKTSIPISNLIEHKIGKDYASMKIKEIIPMKLKDIIHQFLKDKDGNFSMREVIALTYVLMTIIAWIAQQFFGRNIPEFMFYSFISMIGAASFGYSLERRTERELIDDYKTMLDEVLANLTPANHHLAVGLAAIPEKIRGFGHVKQRHLATAKADEAALLEQFRAGAPALLKAAE